MKILNWFYFIRLLLTFITYSTIIYGNDIFEDSQRNNNFLKNVELIIQKCENILKRYNTQILISRFNHLKNNVMEKDVLTGINTTIDLLYENDIYEFENRIDSILEIKKNGLNDILNTQINFILNEFFSSIINPNNISEYIKSSENERKLQLSQVIDNNVTSYIALSRGKNDSNSLIMNRNIPNYYFRPYYNDGVFMGNTQMNHQLYPQTEKKNGLSGVLSVSNPAFKMIITTVLMCLGSTPYGAISILIVVTLYTLIEIVIKYFNNKIKKKNIVNSIKKSTKMNIQNKNDLTTSNSTGKIGRNFTDSINNSLRVLKKSNSVIPQETINLLFDSLKRNEEENIILEEKINYFVGNLSSVIYTDDLFNIYKNRNKMKLFDTLLNTSINVLGQKEYNLTNFNPIHDKYSEIIGPNFLFENKNMTSNDNLPEWYKRISLLSIHSRRDLRILQGYYPSEIWIPIKSNINRPFDEKSLLSDGDGIRSNYSFINEINIPEKVYFEVGNDSVSFNGTEDLLEEIKTNLDNYDNNYLQYKDNPEIKWYDGMIKYSIQTYRKNGIRGVITMILDIFSAIFSTTPIGYLITTLIRLVAFIADKLIQLSRRRKNQRLLARMILELPNTFNDEQLILISKEVRLIDTECNNIIRSIMNLYRNLNNRLVGYNPELQKDLLLGNELIMFRILQNRSKQYITNDKPHLDGHWTLSNNENSKNSNQVSDSANEYTDITSNVIKGAKQENSRGRSVKSSFQETMSGLKSFLLNIFKTVFGGAGELWELIKGILSRIIDFIKTLWDAIRGENRRRLITELIEEMPPDSVVHSELFENIINKIQL